MRPLVPHRVRLVTTLVAIVAVLLAVPFERGRGCDVCPVECPMHAAGGRAKHPGCHHATATSRTPDDGACAMRAGCGHHGQALAAVFHAEPCPVVTATPAVASEAVPVARRIPVVADALQPRPRPPESSVV